MPTVKCAVIATVAPLLRVVFSHLMKYSGSSATETGRDRSGPVLKITRSNCALIMLNYSSLCNKLFAIK